VKYQFRNHETKYKNVLFRSRLEARWAAFFDRVDWDWEYEPFDLLGWTPDFRVRFACSHSECNGEHSLLVEVKPFDRIDQFKGHPCMDYAYGWKEDGGDRVCIPANASAAFGINPFVTYWEMAHGSGGGDENVALWLQPNYCDEEIKEIWKLAGNDVRFLPIAKGHQ